MSSSARSRRGAGTATAAATPAAQSILVLEQQKKYATHLTRQITQLQAHPGNYGQLGHELYDSEDQAKSIGQAIDNAHVEWSKRSRAAATAAVATAGSGSDKENNSNGFDGSPSPLSSASIAPAPAPDLDALASSLEHLARHIAAHEAQAEAQGAALRTDIARVMEVYEDPAAFLPPPLPGAPDFGGYLSASVGAANGSSSRGQGTTTTAAAGKDGAPPPRASSSSVGRQVRLQDPPSELLQQQYGSLALHNQPHLQPEPPQPLYTHTSVHTGFDYGQMSSFIRNMVRQRVSEELDGNDAPTTSFSSNGIGGDPNDPLTALRRDMARKFHALERDPSLAASREAVRKQVQEAASKPQASAAVSAATARLNEGKKKTTRGRPGPSAAADSASTTSATSTTRAPKLKARPESNPDTYPAFAELSQIFGSGGGSGGAGGGGLFGGLAQAIPNYIQYQEYMQSQAVQEEMRRQAEEQRRFEEQQRERAVAERREAKARRAAAEAAAAAAATQAAQVAAATAAAQAAAAAVAVVVPPLALPAGATAVSAQTSSRLMPPASYHSQLAHPDGLRADVATDTRPPLQGINELYQLPSSAAYFGGAGQRFDAIWEVLPSAKDVAVQSDSMDPYQPQPQQHQHQQQFQPQPSIQQQQTIAPSDGAQGPRMLTPRATAFVGGHYPQHELDALQHQESLKRMGHGSATSAPAGPGQGQGPKRNPLSVLEQAALELQKQGGSRVRGEGLSSTKALENLMETAHPHSSYYGSSNLVGNAPSAAAASAESDISVPQHPLFSSNPSRQIAAYPNSGLLNLVLQMYDMPDELQVSAEWKRVMTEEEERESREREERGEAPDENKESEEIKQQAAQAIAREEAERAAEAATDAEALAAKQESDRAAAAAAAEAEAQQKRQAEAEAEASSPAAIQAEELRKRLAEESAERARLVAEAARMSQELEHMKEQQQKQVQAQAEAQEAAAAAAAAAAAPPQLSAAEREAEQKRAWETELRTRWAAEQEMKRLQEAQAALDAARHADQLAQIEAARKALAVEAEIVRAAAAERKASEVETVAPALAAEIERIRQAQQAERSLMDVVREEERKRWEAEEVRRAADRERVAQQHAAEEAQYEARRAEREQEEERRRDLERRRDELLANKIAMENEKTQADLAALRASVERIRQRGLDQPAAAAATAVPVPAASPIRSRPTMVDRSIDSGGSHGDSSSSDLSMFEIDPRGGGVMRLRPGGSSHPKMDLSEGEIDIGPYDPHARLHSPGMIEPPHSAVTFQLHQRPNHLAHAHPPRRPTERHHAASVLHSPIPSVTPARPAATSNSRAHFHSSTRDDIADLLNASRAGGDGDSLDSTANEVDFHHVPVSSQFNLQYTHTIAAAKSALAVPSRQVLVGPSSPPLSDISSPAGSRASTASSEISTPSPVSRHTAAIMRPESHSHHHHQSSSSGAHHHHTSSSASKSALRLLKKKYSALKARQHALEDETSGSLDFDESVETVEEQILSRKQRDRARARFGTHPSHSHAQSRSPTKKHPAAAAAVTVAPLPPPQAAAAAAQAQSNKPRGRSTAHAGTSGEEEEMPSVDVRTQARQAATRADMALAQSSRQTPPTTAEPPPPSNSGMQSRSVVTPQPNWQQQQRPQPREQFREQKYPEPSYQQQRQQQQQQEQSPATPMHPAAAAAAAASSMVDEEWTEAPQSAAAAAEPSYAPSFLTAATPPSSSPPSPVAAKTPATTTTTIRPSILTSSTTILPPAAAGGTGGSRPVSGSAKYLDPPSPTSKPSLLQTAMVGRSAKMSQAAMVAQHRAKLQQAKLASQQQQQQSRPTTAASVSVSASATDPFAAYGSRPSSTSSNSVLGGGIGGLYGMSDRQSVSPGALMDDTADASDHSFNSPANKPTSTEQWIKSLRD